MFAPGTLALITVPAGADTSNTSATGGAKGTGVVDVRNLTAAPGATVLIEFEITLASVIANGTLRHEPVAAADQRHAVRDSDDPNVNGPADPFVASDEDPTVVRIVSGPQLRVQKISTDLTGDPNVLLPGDTLRYTITVKNIGSEDVTDAMFRDSVPANTRYVAGSTTLNGSAVPDGPGGSSPLSAGIPIYAPGDPTPGVLRADPSPRREQRRHDRLRRRDRRGRDRRDGDLEPGLRRARRTSCPSSPRTIRPRRFRTIRRATWSATSRCCSRRSRPRSRSTTTRTDSSIRAT